MCDNNLEPEVPAIEIPIYSTLKWGSSLQNAFKSDALQFLLIFKNSFGYLSFNNSSILHDLILFKLIKIEKFSKLL